MPRVINTGHLVLVLNTQNFSQLPKTEQHAEEIILSGYNATILQLTLYQRNVQISSPVRLSKLSLCAYQPYLSNAPTQIANQKFDLNKL